MVLVEKRFRTIRGIPQLNQRTVYLFGQVMARELPQIPHQKRPRRRARHRQMPLLGSKAAARRDSQSGSQYLHGSRWVVQIPHAKEPSVVPRVVWVGRGFGAQGRDHQLRQRRGELDVMDGTTHEESGMLHVDVLGGEGELRSKRCFLLGVVCHVFFEEGFYHLVLGWIGFVFVFVLQEDV